MPRAQRQQSARPRAARRRVGSLPAASATYPRFSILILNPDPQKLVGCLSPQ